MDDLENEFYRHVKDIKNGIYSRLLMLGFYHHRPDTIRRALDLLGQDDFKADLLLTGARPISGVEQALRDMMEKKALKVVIKKQP